MIPEWEEVIESHCVAPEAYGVTTSRLHVPGGWLVLVEHWNEAEVFMSALQFIPDPKHHWFVPRTDSDRISAIHNAALNLQSRLKSNKRMDRVVSDLEKIISKLNGVEES